MAIKIHFFNQAKDKNYNPYQAFLHIKLFNTEIFNKKKFKKLLNKNILVKYQVFLTLDTININTKQQYNHKFDNKITFLIKTTVFITP